jgi:TolB-like protein
MSERADAKSFGMAYVIAGRVVREITALMISIAESDSDAKMALWSVRYWIVENHRRIQFRPLGWRRR